MAEMKVLSHEAESLARRLARARLDTKDKYTKLARKILQEVQERSEAQEPIDLTVATYALFGMMNWIYNWYDPQGKLKVHDLAQHLKQLFSRGLCRDWHWQPVSSNALPRRTENLSVWNHGLQR